jgi:hypothetical protein
METVAKPLIAVLAVLGVGAALGAAGYAGLRLAGEPEVPNPGAGVASEPGDNGAEHSPDEGGPEGLRAAALSLVPPIASRAPDDADLSEKDCTAGLEERAPPCIHFFFPTEGVPLGERQRAVRGNAAQNGWRPWRRNAKDGFVYFRQGPYRARLALNADLPDGFVDRFPALNEIMVFDLSRQPAPEPPPDPSGWSAEKRAFVAKANGICRRVTREVKPLAKRGPSADANLIRVADVWGDGTDEIAALEVPPDDERAVERMILEFRRFERALRILTRVEGEMTLAAAVGTFQQAKRADKAARAYGVTGCSELA